MNNKTLMISSSLLATSLFLGAGSAQADTTTNNNMNQQDMAMNGQMGQMNNNMNQQDMAMNEQMGQMNNNMNQQDMAMNEQMGQMNNNMDQQGMSMNGQMGQMNNNMDQQGMSMNGQMGQMNNNMNQQDMAMNEQMNHMEQTTMMPYYNYNGYTTYDGQFTQDYDFVRALQYDNVMIDGYKVNTATSDKDVASSKTVYDSMIDMNKDGQVIHITFETKPDTVSKEMFEKAHMSNHMVDEGKTTDGSYMTYETNNGMYKAFFDKQGYLMKVMIS